MVIYENWNGFTKDEILYEAEEELLYNIPIIANGFQCTEILQQLRRDFTRKQLIGLINSGRFEQEYLARSPVMADRARAVLLGRKDPWPPELCRLFFENDDGGFNFWIVVFADYSCIGDSLEYAYDDPRDVFESAVAWHSRWILGRTILIETTQDSTQVEPIRAELEGRGFQDVRVSQLIA